MSDNITIFKAAVYWPRFYKPSSLDGVREHETYGCSVDWEDVPGEITQFVPRRKFKGDGGIFTNRHGRTICEFGSFNQRYAPQIMTHDNRHSMGEIVSLRDFMRASNLPEDLLFDGVKAEIAVATVMLPAQASRFKPMPERPASFIRALRFDYTDLIASYDRLCERYFADPTLPYRGPEIR